MAKPSQQLRRRLERRLIAANSAAGMLLAAYFNSTSPLPEGISESRFWLLSMVSSAALAGSIAVIAVPIARRIIDPRVAWLDGDRKPTPAERDFILRGPLYIAAAIFLAWILTAVIIGLGRLAGRDGTGEAVQAGLGTVLGGLTATAISYLVTERLLRPVVARVLEGQPATATTVGIRLRLLLAWVLGSGIPLLGIALTPLVRDSDAHLPLSVPVVILACMGVLAGAAITRNTAMAVAEPMTQLRRGLERVETGDLDVKVDVDDPGEIGLVEAGFNRMVEGLRQRRRLHDLFGRYVGEELARRALDEEHALEGELRDVTVFFVDLVNSTGMARAAPPSDVVATLNRFYEAVVDVAAEEEGWVHKFEGDGALCVWGAPVEQPDHCQRALRAARRLRDLLGELGLEAGIGVASGQVVAGNVGPETRCEYTVIGAPVHEAARLTEAAKRHPARLLTTVADHDSWDPAGTIELRGLGPKKAYAPASN